MTTVAESQAIFRARSSRLPKGHPLHDGVSHCLRSTAPTKTATSQSGHTLPWPCRPIANSARTLPRKSTSWRLGFQAGRVGSLSTRET